MAFVRMLAKLLRDEGDRQADRADRSRRGAHVRHGSAVPAVRHLLAPGAALRAGRPERTCLLPRKPRTGRSWRKASPKPVRMSSFIAAGTAYSNHGINTIPVLHLLLHVRAAARRRPGLGRRRQPLQGLPAGRHIRPHDAGRRRAAAPGRQQPPAGLCRAEPDGLRSGLCLRAGRDHRGRSAPHVRRGRRHLLLHHGLNENYAQPTHAGGCREGILKGMYRVRGAGERTTASVRLLGSGTILNEALKAADLLADEYERGGEVWSVTSYKELHRDAEERTLESAASGRGAARAVYRAVSRRVATPRSSPRRTTLRPCRSRSPAGCPARWIIAGNGRVRPQRRPGGPARLLRGGCAPHCVRGPGHPCARRALDKGVAMKARDELSIQPEET